jgi:DNA-binding NarL/FixJ family response regulator
MNALPHILVVEDEQVVRLSVVSYLSDENYDVVGVANGRDALGAIAVRRPDLVLLDLRMPEMDGLEFLREIRGRNDQTPIVVLSGGSSVEDAAAALRLGAWDYLIKPIGDLNHLNHVVMRCLERAQLLAENQRYREHLEREVESRTQALDAANRELGQKNIALREVLAAVHEQVEAVRNGFVEQIEQYLVPEIKLLRNSDLLRDSATLERMENVLVSLTTPPDQSLSDQVAHLTPAELRMCSLVRQGLTAKEIAEQEHLSVETVNTHRKNIRRKLGLTNQKISLTTRLQTRP